MDAASHLERAGCPDVTVITGGPNDGAAATNTLLRTGS